MRICLEQSAFPGVIRVTEKVAHDVKETADSGRKRDTGNTGKQRGGLDDHCRDERKKQLPEKAGRSRECGIKRAGTKERMLCMDFS